MSVNDMLGMKPGNEMLAAEPITLSEVRQAQVLPEEKKQGSQSPLAGIDMSSIGGTAGSLLGMAGGPAGAAVGGAIGGTIGAGISAVSGMNAVPGSPGGTIESGQVGGGPSDSDQIGGALSQIATRGMQMKSVVDGSGKVF